MGAAVGRVVVIRRSQTLFWQYTMTITALGTLRRDSVHALSALYPGARVCRLQLRWSMLPLRSGPIGRPLSYFSAHVIRCVVCVVPLSRTRKTCPLLVEQQCNTRLTARIECINRTGMTGSGPSGCCEIGRAQSMGSFLEANACKGCRALSKYPSDPPGWLHNVRAHYSDCRSNQKLQQQLADLRKGALVSDHCLHGYWHFCGDLPWHRQELVLFLTQPLRIQATASADGSYSQIQKGKQ